MTEFDWKMFDGRGPVLGVALHAGNRIREKLAPYFKLTLEERRREEDPMTDIWATTCDHMFINYTSRFVVDLNRARDKAIYLKPEDAWGIQVWKEDLPSKERDASLNSYDHFYKLISDKIERMIEEYGKIILLDIHSYNHQRDGEGKISPLSLNPDIDLGLTTADSEKFSDSIRVMREVLENSRIRGREIFVGENIRYPTGGHFPEWVYSTYKENVCCITLEIKKIYMNEWTGQVDLVAVEDIRVAIQKAINEAKKVL